MITPVKKVADFIKEVWRRRVFHIAIPYGVVSWVLLQVADVVLPAFEPPAWVFKALLFTLVAGFPVAVIIAWIFDYGPKGIVRTSVQDLLKAGGDDPEEMAAPKPAPAIALELGKSERRRVTMLHCAVRVNSIDDDELDPEDLATLLKGIEQISNAIVEQYEGFRLPGNPEEVSIVFGYPHAHDDDARRAVAAGVALLERIETMSFPGVSEGEVSVSTHAAAHSGLVVVDDSNADGTGISVVGRVPRITSWLETMAPDNALVVSQFTHRLISPYFKSIDLGSKESVQLGGSFNVFHIERALEPSDEPPLEEHVFDMLVGRDHELRLLEDRWENVVEGDQQYVLMKGEAGIGKSSIVRAFKHYASHTANAWLVSWHCSPYEQNSEFQPVIQSLIIQFFEFKEQDSNAQKLEIIEAVLLAHSVDSEAAIPLLANLLSLDLPGDSGHQLSSATSQVLRNRTMELLVNLFHSLASQKPVLLMVESLHCSDPSTRELIKMILEHGSIPGMFLFMTSRPDYRPDWSNRSSVMEFDVQCLSRRSSGQMVKKIAGDRELPESLIKRIVDETDGIPMYIQALTRALFESDEWQNDKKFSGRELASIHIPATLQESLAARLDKLGSAKTLLQVCSLLGREFSYKLLLAVSETDNEKALKEELNRVVDADMLFKRRTGSELTYTFRHILIQEAASQSLLKSTRKILHIRIAEAKETRFPETVAQRPHKLAYHFSEGGMTEKAIQYWTAAGRRSVMRSANLEAIEDARAGLKLIDKLAESNERNMMEIPLQSILGSALLGSQGYTAPEVKDVFTRARKLCEQIDNDEHLFQILVGLWMYYEVSAEYTYALDIGSQLIRIANSTGNAGQLVQAHYSQGYTQFYRGEFEAAKEQFEQALSYEVEGGDFSSQSASGDDTRTHVRCMLAHAYWHLGMPKTASKFARQANKLAHELEQPFAITFISFFNGWFHQFRREPRQTIAYAEECVDLATENGYGFFIPLGHFLLAWAEIHSPEPASGSESQGQLEKMKTFLEISLGTGVGTGVSYLLFLFAEVLVELGRYDEALEQLENGRQHVEKVGERFLESEYYRLKGCVFLARYRNNKERLYLDGAIDHLTQALSRANIKHDKGLALRAAIDLAEALSQLGDRDGAVDAIDSVLSTFEETDKSGDFIRARELRKKLQ